MEELEKLGHELRHLDEIFDRKKRLMNEIAVKTQEGKISPAKPGFQEDETVQKLNELEEKHPDAGPAGKLKGKLLFKGKENVPP